MMTDDIKAVVREMLADDHVRIRAAHRVVLMAWTGEKLVPATGRPVVIYGPQGCGKSRHAEALAKHYGKARIIHEGRMVDRYPADALVLTNDSGVPGAIAFDDAMRAAGLRSPIPGPAAIEEPQRQSYSGLSSLRRRSSSSKNSLASADNSANTAATTAGDTSAPNTDSHMDLAVTKRS